MSEKEMDRAWYAAAKCQHVPMGACLTCIGASLAAAEERGRRAGIGEARSLVGFVRHLQALVADGYAEGALNAIRALREKDFPILAPRDSGKET